MSIIKNISKIKKKIKDILSRFDLTKRKKELRIVEDIYRNVLRDGDKALIYYTEKFDKVKLNKLKITNREINNSTKYISRKLLAAIRTAIHRVTTFHHINMPKSWLHEFNLNEKLGCYYIPINSVAIYIPGGKIPLISTLIMTAVPAKAAGIKRISVFTPPPVHKGVLAVCKLLGIKEVYQIGGAQAIFAAGLGTKSIKASDKIIGPGNIYVTLAKKIIFGKAAIDGLYGPSEIAVIADGSANPEYLAMDLLSQLEHGSGLESAFMITNDEKLALKTQKAVLRFAKNLPNKNIVLNSWKNNSAICVVRKLKIACRLINDLAPEHLEIITKRPGVLLPLIKNAGAVFLGEYSCESIGDYIAGPSHCLPTGGSARFSSGLTVMDFFKKTSVISFNKKSFEKVAHHVIELADAEKLKAHRDAVRMRLQDVIARSEATKQSPKRKNDKE